MYRDVAIQHTHTHTHTLMYVRTYGMQVRVGGSISLLEPVTDSAQNDRACSTQILHMIAYEMACFAKSHCKTLLN